MSTADECRQFAKDCSELAQTTTSNRHRTLLLEIAQRWLHLAADAQHSAELSGDSERCGADMRH
jgi:hypothetical protein